MSVANFSPSFPIAVPPPPSQRTLADLLSDLGDIDPSRICYPPAVGMATEQDLLAMHAQQDRICELVDGILVEKPMGLPESLLAAAIISFLRAFVKPRKLGFITGESGPMRLFPGLVRIPDVAFISWTRAGGRVPREQVPSLAPDLAIEVLSPSNTRGEMARKLRENFSAGVRLVWIFDPPSRTVAVYTTPDQFTTLGENDVLDGGDVLPGFTLPLAELFAEVDEQGNG